MLPTFLSGARRATLAAGVVALSAALLWPPGLATAGPLPPPPPAPPPGQVFDVDAVPRLDWSVPDRFDTVWDSWRPSTSTYDPELVTPDKWSVTLDGCGSTSVRRINEYVFTLAQTGTSWKRTYAATSCSLPLRDRLPDQGNYTATLTLRTDWGNLQGVSGSVERPVTIRDYLIVSMGDSFASGEGNPDRAGSYDVTTVGGKVVSVDTNRPARWQDKRCHRSARSGHALAAQSYEAASKYTSVTFVSFACSGAQIRHLISKRYKGIVPQGSSDVAPQITAVNRLVGRGSPQGPRKIDALLISVGANDVDWSEILRRCAQNPNVGNHTSCVTEGGLSKKVAGLSSSFSKLARALRPLSVREVYLNTYPANLFRGAGCDIFSLPGIGIDGPESRTLFAWGKRVNQEIVAAAHKYRSNGYRWNVIPDLTEPFSDHAYCDRPSWFRNYLDSHLMQGDENGTVHPNSAGHAAFRDLITSSVVLDQTAQVNRRVTVRINQIWARSQTRHPVASINTTLFADQSGYAQTRYLKVPRNGRWTTIPTSQRTFTVDMYRPRSSPRHAIALEMVLDHSLLIKHDRFDGYGPGTYEQSWDGGRYRVRYTISVMTPAG